MRKQGEERGESNNVVWFIEKTRGRVRVSGDENVELLFGSEQNEQDPD